MSLDGLRRASSNKKGGLNMISNAEKKVLKDSVDLMWDCYQEIAHAPEDDHWSRICMRAKDVHQAILADHQEILEGNSD